jgi:hypothetical protein
VNARTIATLHYFFVIGTDTVMPQALAQDSHRAPIEQKASTCARLRKAGINQHSGSREAHSRQFYKFHDTHKEV